MAHPAHPHDALIDEWCVARAYSGATGVAVRDLKFRGQTALAAQMAHAIVLSIPFDLRQRIDVVTFAPTSARRRSARGYDQAELIARRVARMIDRPVHALLYRHAPPQTGQSRTERQQLVVKSRRARGVVLLIDDVVTTGATMRACAGALKAAGARVVVAGALAQTPRIGTANGQISSTI